MSPTVLPNALFLLVCLVLGTAGGFVFAELCVRWSVLPRNDPSQFLALGLYYLGAIGGMGCYFVCLAALKRIRSRAVSEGPESDFDDDSASTDGLPRPAGPAMLGKMDERVDYDDEPDRPRVPSLLMLIGWFVVASGLLGIVAGFFGLFYMAANIAPDN